MGYEIERKFLTISDSWRTHPHSAKRLVQGYLATAQRCTVRVRLEETLKFPDDPDASPLETSGSKSSSHALQTPQKAWITIKGPVQGITRSEFEYEIPPEEARELLSQFCNDSIIDKIRYDLHVKGKLWEIDEFKHLNQGLIVAEVTLSHEAEAFALPDWLGQEVSDDPRYFNSQLTKNPFKNWKAKT